MSKTQHIKFGLVLAIMLSVSFISTPKANAATCADIEFIFAKGSATTEPDTENPRAWRESFENLALIKNLNVNFYNLGTGNYNEASYPAAAIGLSSFNTFLTTLSATIPGEKYGTFNRSVNLGVAELTGRIKSVSDSCPNTKFVLGGYSQGAMVIDRTLEKLDPKKIIFAATFGDPNLYLPEGEGTNPPACRNEKFSDYRIYAPNCRASEGLLGPRKPYVPQNFTGKVGLFCNTKDIVCTKKLDETNPIGDHIAYASAGIYDRSAKYILQKIAEVYPEKIKQVETVAPLHAKDTAFLIDTTGSMGSHIKEYQNEALKLAKNTLKNGGRIALYEYRDLKADGKEFVPKELCNFSCTYDEFSKLLDDIKPSGGGDAPESALSASLGAMNKLGWQKGATKSIVLLTDAPFHNPDLDNTTLEKLVQRSLEIDPVNFYVVTTPGNTKNYSKLAEQTGGKVFRLGTADIETSTTTILNRPTLNLDAENYTTYVGNPLTFILTTDVSAEHYEWDLDFDGIFETKTNLPIITKKYIAETSGFIQAKIVTSAGLSSTASAKVTVLPLIDDDSKTVKLNIEGGKGSGIPIEPKTAPKVPLAPNTGSPRR